MYSVGYRALFNNHTCTNLNCLMREVGAVVGLDHTSDNGGMMGLSNNNPKKDNKYRYYCEASGPILCYDGFNLISSGWYNRCHKLVRQHRGKYD